VRAQVVGETKKQKALNLIPSRDLVRQNTALVGAERSGRPGRAIRRRSSGLRGRFIFEERARNPRR
jgi:hypothetical protein